MTDHTAPAVADPATGPLTRARTNLAIVERLADLRDATTLTDDDHALLSQWAGWGPMARAFEQRAGEPSWATIGQRLAVVLSPEALTSARAATTTAYYTAGAVMETMWRIATELGIDEGARVLEPGCGSGRFLSAAPFDIAATGIEVDPTSARIAQLLHPGAAIHQAPLQEVVLRDEAFDLAIGNVPFSDVVPFDKSHPEHGLSLHNYFMWRAMQALAPGGWMVTVTSRYSLDAPKSLGWRLEMERLGEFVGAIRLPKGTFKSTGTEVVADIIVMRRRQGELDEVSTSDLGWWSNQTFGNSYGPAYSRYFATHPTHVLGTLGVGRGQYRNDELTCTADPDVDVRIPLAHAAVDLIRAGEALPTIERRKPKAGPVVHEAADGRKLGSFHLSGNDDGTIVQIVPDAAGIPVAKPAGKSKELLSLIVLRNAVLDLLDAEANPNRDDTSLRIPRAILNAVYDAYVDTYGPVNRCSLRERGVDDETGVKLYSRIRPQMGGFRQDPDYVAVLAVEDFDDDTGVARKGPIFSQRVNRPADPVTRVGTAGEAIAVSMDRHGTVDVNLVAALLGLSIDEAIEAIDGQAFIDPATNEWVPASEYLSGNVRRKLAQAREAVKRDPRVFHANVARLTAVQPADLMPSEIMVRLGAPWLPLNVVHEFVLDLLRTGPAAPNWGGALIITHEKVTATWAVEAPSYLRRQTWTWGTSRVDPFRLIELGLNNDQPVVTDTVVIDGKDRQVRNVGETLLACDKLNEIQERFATWVWSDPERSRRLAALYNERYNSTVLPEFTGDFLTFPDMVDGFTPYDSQLSMVARNMATPATGCGHVVGAGKTSIMGMTAIKMRETGMANKPAAIVPNHLVEQIGREIKALFPTTRILMATSDDTKKDRRKLFAAKVATGDWDCIVMTHSAFTAIPIGPELEREYLAEKVATYRRALHAMESTSEKGGARTCKQLEKAIAGFIEKSKKLMDHRTDDGVTFEQLGIDYLMVDEAHYFKNLGFPSRARYAPPASKRAEDLSLKLWALRTRRVGHSGKVGMLLSGTLISNTLAEMYVMQSYLQPERLVELEVDAFDAWAGNFILDETKIEVAPDGGSFRMHTRPARFQNVPDLRRLFGEVVDIRTREMLNLDRPDIDMETVVIPPSEALTRFVDSLVARADRLRTERVDPTEDNMLMVCNDGRKAALDLELVGVYSDDPGKIAVVVQNVHRSWLEHRDTVFNDMLGQPSDLPGNLQVVFCDLGTPNPDKGTQVYGKIRRGLIAAGMPAESIRFIHEAKTDNAKGALFSECRAGKVSVLLGSTDKLGVGTNVQARLTDIHHVDAPWRPADVEQRDGRGDRPGNQNAVLRIRRYVRERSFDAYMWQGLERKDRFIKQVLTGDNLGRVVDDIGSASTLSFGEVKALATGNPLVMRHAEAEAIVTKLRRVKQGHLDTQRDLNWEAEQLFRASALAGGEAEKFEQLGAKVDSDAGWLPSRFARDVPLVEKEDVGLAVGHLIVAQFARGTSSVCGVGTMRGIELAVSTRKNHYDENVATMYAVVNGEHFNLFEVEARLWLKEGQWWRLGAALADVLDVEGMEKLAAKKRASAEHFEERAEGMLAQRGEFTQQAALDEAELELAAILQAMSDAMAEDEKNKNKPAAA